MAGYQYYQGAPNYGTSSYQFMAPPMPSYQPQPNWTGSDYYRAHYGNTDSYYDSSLFGDIWGRLKNWISGGVGREEAMHWHRRVYGGMVDITRLLPTELGAAAGFEAWRNWDSHNSLYRGPLMDDRDREREALVGLAIAEATKLWSYCGRPSDTYGRREISEVAAGTAERMRRKANRYEYDNSPYGSYEGSRSRSRRGSFSSAYGDDYDDGYSRSRHRRRSSGSYHYPVAGALTNPGYYPGQASTSLALAPQYSQPFPGVQYGGGQQYGYGTGTSAPGYTIAYPQQQTAGYTVLPSNQLMAPTYQRSRAHSFSYAPSTGGYY